MIANKQNIKKPVEKKKESKILRHVNIGRISITEFSNEVKTSDNKIVEISTFTITKSYKDESGNYQRSNSFSISDLASLVVGINRALNKSIDEKELPQQEETE